MASGISHRKWVLWRDDYEDEATFHEAVQSELAQTQFLCDRLGVALISSPLRDKLDRADGKPSEFFSQGWAFQTASIPAAAREPAPEESESDSAVWAAEHAEPIDAAA